MPLISEDNHLRTGQVEGIARVRDPVPERIDSSVCRSLYLGLPDGGIRNQVDNSTRPWIAREEPFKRAVTVRRAVMNESDRPNDGWPGSCSDQGINPAAHQIRKRVASASINTMIKPTVAAYKDGRCLLAAGPQYLDRIAFFHGDGEQHEIGRAHV